MHLLRMWQFNTTCPNNSEIGYKHNYFFVVAKHDVSDHETLLGGKKILEFNICFVVVGKMTHAGGSGHYGSLERTLLLLAMILHVVIILQYESNIILNNESTFA